MGLSRKQKIILGVLAVLMVLVWGRALTSRGPRSAGRSVPAPVGSRPSAPVKTEASLEVVYPVPSGWGDSPFLADRGKVSPSPEAGEMGPVLNGILWDSQAPSALINNQLVTSGSRVGRWTVVEIQKDKVLLSDGSETKTLSVE